MTITPVRPAELADAFALLYGPGADADVGHAFGLVARGELNPNDILVAHRDGALIGAVFASRLPGGVAVVWSPRAVGDDLTLEDALTAAALGHVAGAKAVQAFLPPEEGGELLAACTKHDLKTVFIVAPTTPAGRLARIGAAATGFIYYVSREGVTGVRDQVAANIPEAVARIRQHTSLPVAVGFGISTREQVRQVARHADGVVVGSALVNVIKDNLDNRAGLLVVTLGHVVIL